MIKLGQTVRDRVTGIEGIAISRSEWLFSCARIGVQQKVKKDGTVPDTIDIDEPQLEVTDAKQVMKTEEPEQTIALGAKVKDPITKLKGIVTGRAVYLNGCSRVVIQTETDKQQKFDPGAWYPEQQLEVINKKSIFGFKIAKTEKEKKEQSVKTGGPALVASFKPLSTRR